MDNLRGARSELVLVVEAYTGIFNPVDPNPKSKALLHWENFDLADYNQALIYAYNLAHPSHDGPITYEQTARLRLFGLDSGWVTAVITLESINQTWVKTAACQGDIEAAQRVAGVYYAWAN